MSTAELPCYTLINVPSDFETPNEMQLKADLAAEVNRRQQWEQQMTQTMALTWMMPRHHHHHQYHIHHHRLLSIPVTINIHRNSFEEEFVLKLQ